VGAEFVSETIVVTLEPGGPSFTVERGVLLREVLAGHGCETPCGGQGTCGGCRIRVTGGELPVTDRDRRVFTPAELTQGWRLGCAARAEADVTLMVGGGIAPVLGDASAVGGGRRHGLGVAIDLGTTTLAVQLVDLASGALLGSRSGLNPQARFGADVMSRVRAAMLDDQPTRLIRAHLGQMVEQLVRGRGGEVVDIVIVGNTVMHHLFAGLSVRPLASTPFASPCLGEHRFVPAALGWSGLPDAPLVRVLPCLGGFVGSDILAGIVAAGLGEQDGLRALVDLGTNGEIALGNRQRILVASTAAGTAFEAGSIAMGMRAAAGAVSQVTVGADQRFECVVIGGGEARGLCGSGVVGAVAAGLSTGAIRPSGRLDSGKTLAIAGSVHLTQADVRELQLAKGAIAAGLRILLKQWGAAIGAVDALILSGAFGNYVDPASAIRIGLVETAAGRVVPAGNTALRGAKMLLGCEAYPVLDLVSHVALAADPDFEDIFTACMGFPAGDDRRLPCA
jgi:uncharacterized 2Fe-2S/4Fe-4S cluster protein (DUF4445 family)